jgi:hypothetical protein
VQGLDHLGSLAGCCAEPCELCAVPDAPADLKPQNVLLDEHGNAKVVVVVGGVSRQCSECLEELRHVTLTS